LFPRAEEVVVCPPEPRGELLQAACLAGTLHVPLLVTDAGPGEAGRLRERFEEWGVNRVVAAGAAACPTGGRVRVEALRDADAVAAARRRALARGGRADAVVVATPADTGPGPGGMSALAPLVALRKHAPLLLTNPAGDDAEAAVLAATRGEELREVE